MKKLLTLAALAGLLGTQQCLAFAVNVAQNGGYYYDSGGEFTITDPPPPLSVADIYANYDTKATVGLGFQTFCISRSIYVQNSGNSLDATVDPNGVANGTAWLYSAFATGQLAGYDYTTDGGRPTSAWALQNAIWELQGQAYDASNLGASNYVYMAKSEFGSLANAMADSGGQLGVDQLQMTYNGVTSQPMLAFVGVPDGGATLMLLGLGLSSLGAFSRRFRA
jgi:hypothetical protein